MLGLASPQCGHSITPAERRLTLAPEGISVWLRTEEARAKLRPSGKITSTHSRPSNSDEAPSCISKPASSWCDAEFKLRSLNTLKAWSTVLTLRPARSLMRYTLVCTLSQTGPERSKAVWPCRQYPNTIPRRLSGHMAWPAAERHPKIEAQWCANTGELLRRDAARFRADGLAERGQVAVKHLPPYVN